MMEQQDWGPWVEHDGKGCPVAAGQIVEAELEGWPNRVFRYTYVHLQGGQARNWDWSHWLVTDEAGYVVCRILRYRTRQSAQMDLLRRIAAAPEALNIYAAV